MRKWINTILVLNEVNFDRSSSTVVTDQPIISGEKKIDIPVWQLLKYTVHTATGEIDADRVQINNELRSSIEKDGVLSPVLLDIDTKRKQARLANGNHRVVMAHDINPSMMIPTIIRTRGDLKRPLSSAKPYDGYFD